METTSADYTISVDPSKLPYPTQAGQSGQIPAHIVQFGYSDLACFGRITGIPGGWLER